MENDKKKAPVEYLNIPMAFDIETTSTTYPQAGVSNRKVAFMYVWMFGIEGEPIKYGHCWESFVDHVNFIQKKYDLNHESRRAIVYVHNLAYEFQFMRKLFKWVDSFSLSERKPIKALTEQGIEFRCSYILSASSLAVMARNLVTRKDLCKLDDLDYKLIRTPETPLTEAEIGYCDADIEIILVYIREQIDYYKHIKHIPLTNTGRVRNYLKQICLGRDGTDSKGKKRRSNGQAIKFRSLMQDLTLSPDTYAQMRRGFMGGFTHANANYVGETLQGVTSLDFTSSYPAVMLMEMFPMSKFKTFIPKDYNALVDRCITHAVIMDIKFINIRPTIKQENYISESKCTELVNPVTNNGRVVSADELAMTITEVDLQIIQATYEWDEVLIGTARYATKGRLPKPFAKAILDLYEKKEVLKGVEGQEQEYMISKGMLNSLYGMCVTDIAKDDSMYCPEHNEWGTAPADKAEKVAKHNSSYGRLVYYPWGVWITAYARRNLWTGILAVGDDYVYSDTDSLKFLNYESHKEYVDEYQDEVAYKLKLAEAHYKLKMPSDIGMWDYEGTYEKFKTLGAKRYLTDGKVTVAGLSSNAGERYLRKLSLLSEETKKLDVEEFFTDDLTIPANETGKNTHTYIDEEITLLVTDYLGNTCEVTTPSGIHLEECEFTLSLSTTFKEFLSQLGSGYFHRGVKYV